MPNYFGIKIGTKHTWSDYGLRCLKCELTAPEAVTYYLTVPGMDGELDLTDTIYGRVTYKPRTLTVDFESVEDNKAEHSEQCALLDRLYCGKTNKIILDSDKEHYIYGRIDITHTHSNIYGKHSFKVKCDPYRYKTTLTSRVFKISGSLQITLINSQMPVCPTFYTNNSGMEVVYKNTRANIIQGGVTIPEITLAEGNNTLTLYGTGTVTIEYREGVL